MATQATDRASRWAQLVGPKVPQAKLVDKLCSLIEQYKSVLAKLFPNKDLDTLVALSRKQLLELALVSPARHQESYIMPEGHADGTLQPNNINQPAKESGPGSADLDIPSERQPLIASSQGYTLEKKAAAEALMMLQQSFTAGIQQFSSHYDLGSLAPPEARTPGQQSGEPAVDVKRQKLRWSKQSDGARQAQNKKKNRRRKEAEKAKKKLNHMCDQLAEMHIDPAATAQEKNHDFLVQDLENFEGQTGGKESTSMSEDEEGLCEAIRSSLAVSAASHVYYNNPDLSLDFVYDVVRPDGRRADSCHGHDADESKGKNKGPRADSCHVHNTDDSESSNDEGDWETTTSASISILGSEPRSRSLSASSVTITGDVDDKFYPQNAESSWGQDIDDTATYDAGVPNVNYEDEDLDLWDVQSFGEQGCHKAYNANAGDLDDHDKDGEFGQQDPESSGKQNVDEASNHDGGSADGHDENDENANAGNANGDEGYSLDDDNDDADSPGKGAGGDEFASIFTSESVPRPRFRSASLGIRFLPVSQQHKYGTWRTAPDLKGKLRELVSDDMNEPTQGSGFVPFKDLPRSVMQNAVPQTTTNVLHPRNSTTAPRPVFERPVLDQRRIDRERSDDHLLPALHRHRSQSSPPGPLSLPRDPELDMSPRTGDDWNPKPRLTPIPLPVGFNKFYHDQWNDFFREYPAANPFQMRTLFTNMTNEYYFTYAWPPVHSALRMVPYPSAWTLDGECAPPRTRWLPQARRASGSVVHPRELAHQPDMKWYSPERDYWEMGRWNLRGYEGTKRSQTVEWHCRHWVEEFTSYGWTDLLGNQFFKDWMRELVVRGRSDSLGAELVP